MYITIRDNKYETTTGYVAIISHLNQTIYAIPFFKIKDDVGSIPHLIS